MSPLLFTFAPLTGQKELPSMHRRILDASHFITRLNNGHFRGVSACRVHGSIFFNLIVVPSIGACPQFYELNRNLQFQSLSGLLID